MPKKYSNSGGKSSGSYNKRKNDASSSSKRSFAYADTYYKNFNTKEADLNDARVVSVLSGLPFVGGVIRGFEQARYAEDYYKNTGMVPKYPSLAPGYSGLVSSLGHAALGAASLGRGSGGYNVKEGTNDLLSFYNYAYQ